MSYDIKKAINNKKNILEVSAYNEHKNSTNTDKKYNLLLKPVDASILHPSFLCPTIIKSGEKLKIILLTDDAFFNAFEKAKGKVGKKAGPSISGAINRQLKFVDWGNIDKTRLADVPIFKTTPEAIENIDVHYLWDLSDISNRVLKNKDEKIFGLIHPKVMEMYVNENLTHGFEITISNHNKSDGLYDLSWMNYISKDNTEDGTGCFFEKQDKIIESFNKDFRNSNALSCTVGDNKPTFTVPDNETDIDFQLQAFHPVYISTKDKLNIGHLTDVHVSSRQHVFTKSKARIIEPIEGSNSTVQSTKIGNMVNTSYESLKNLMEQYGDDEDIDVLVFTGDLIDYNCNYNPDNGAAFEKTGDIWQAMSFDNLNDENIYPKGIDNLTIYELFRWYYNTYNKPILLTSGNHEAYTLPYGISPRVYTPIEDLKNTKSRSSKDSKHKKNLTEIIEDHGYTMPTDVREGLVERITSKYADPQEAIEKSLELNENIYSKILEKREDENYKPTDSNRANEGIPADHNLTIYEACLMYGKEYDRVVMGGFAVGDYNKNFNYKNLDWFYHLFTPLTDYQFSYGDEQTFIGLEWGDDEKFIDIQQGALKNSESRAKLKEKGFIGYDILGFGVLPQATESVNDEQKMLIEEALKNDTPQKILMSHFTYTNYSLNVALNDEGAVNINGDTLGIFDYGTFTNNRQYVYDLIVQDKIQITLSGHSHRAALYQKQRIDDDWKFHVFRRINDKLIVKAIALDKGQYSNIDSDKTVMLVSACGGPIAVQNHYGELLGCGLDRPSGSYIKNGKMGVFKATNKTAQPRFAVALDFMDILGPGKHENNIGVFKSFHSSKNNPFNFIITLNDTLCSIEQNSKTVLPNIEFIKNINFHGYQYSRDSTKVISLPSSFKYIANTHQYNLEFTTAGLNQLKMLTRGSNKFDLYIEFEFNDKLTSIDGFKQYSYDSSWIIPIQLADHKKRIMNGRMPVMKKDGYKIIRHPKHGEVPDFELREDSFGENYQASK